MAQEGGVLSQDQSRKLVARYQKLHAELQTVKAAYVATQEKVSAVESIVKDKEVVLRSSVEENDMLTFNNQRLTKRVEQLMIQLQEEKSMASSSWGGFFSGAKDEIARLNTQMAVSNEQLCRTLKENESLVSQMCQLRVENDDSVETLDLKFEELGRHAEMREQDIIKCKMQCEASIMELTDEKTALGMKLQVMDRELEATRALMSEREQTMTTINRQLSTDLERTQHLYDHKVAFDDTRVTEYNKQNVPGFDRVLMVRKIDIAEEALSLLDTLASAFRIHDAALRERFNVMGRNLSAMSKLHRVNEKLSSLVPERLTHLESLQEACIQAVLQMKSVLDMKLQSQLGGVKALTVADRFKRVVLYYNKMLPYELLSLVEEARKDTCVPVLQARNYVLVSTHKRFVAALDKLSVYVQLAFRTEKHSRAQEANESAILKYAYDSMSCVHKEFQAYASHLISKISQEHRAPFVLPELKAVNEKMLNSLSTLVTLTGKMVELLNAYLSINSTHTVCIIRGVECDPLQMSEDIAPMQTRARGFFTRLHTKTPPVRVGYEEALRARRELATIDAAKEGLRKQIQEKDAQCRLAEAELAHIHTELQTSVAAQEGLQAEVVKLRATVKKQEAEAASLKAMAEKKPGAGDGPKEALDPVPQPAEPAELPSELVSQLQEQLALRDKEILLLQAKVAKLEESKVTPDKVDTGEAAPSTHGAIPAPSPIDQIDGDSSSLIDSLRAERDMNLMRYKDDVAAHEAEVARLREENQLLRRERTLDDEYATGSKMEQIEHQLWNTSPLVRVSPGGSAKYSMSVSCADGTRMEPVLLSEESRKREQLIKCFYESKIQQLHKQIAITDKKYEKTANKTW